MPLNRLAPLTIAALLLPTQIFAATPANTAPDRIVLPGSPQAAAIAFMQAVFTGDEKAVYNSLFFADDDAKKEAEAVIGEVVAERQFQKALADVLNKRPEKDDMAAAMADIKKSIANAKVTAAGDTAEVACQPGPTLFTMRTAGQWKIDFAKTQQASRAMAPGEIAQAAAEGKIYRDLTADIKANKFKTAAEATQELDKRMAALPPAIDETPKIKQTQAALANVKTALQAFEVKFDRLPTTEEGLAALIVGPKSLPTWDRPFLQAMPTDGWGRPFIYHSNGASLELFSAGPDGKEGTADDVK